VRNKTDRGIQSMLFTNNLLKLEKEFEGVHFD
jgi:hypothetical protein